jgi:hypothetical protein
MKVFYFIFAKTFIFYFNLWKNESLFFFFFFFLRAKQKNESLIHANLKLI